MRLPGREEEAARWAMTSDGQRFLMVKDARNGSEEEDAGAEVYAVLNWFEELEARRPVK